MPEDSVDSSDEDDQLPMEMSSDEDEGEMSSDESG